MTADTTSPLLGLLLQGTGNNNNSWGQDNNDQVITLTENAIAGAVHIVSTGGTYTLNAAEARSAILIIDNTTLVSDLTIAVPDTTKIWTIINNNTKAAGFFVLLKASSVFPINIPFQRTTFAGSQGGGFLFRLDAAEVGRYVYDAVAAGDEVLECDGAYYKRASLPNLYARIGTTFGTTDSSNFRVPLANDTGRFLRSRSSGVVAGTSQSNQNKSHTHTGSGTTSGQSVTHTHTGSGTTAGASVDHTHTGSGTTATQSADHTHTGSGTTATESALHSHTGTTDGPGVSLNHSHTVAGTTAAESATHTHTSALGTVAINNGGGASQGNLLTTVGGSAANVITGTESATHTHTFSATSSSVDLTHTHTFTTATESAAHTHTYSFTTSGVSAAHTHTYSFTTSGVSADHTHTYSFTTSTGSVDHTHTYSFTTSTGSSDGAEARPESLVAVLCIRY